MGWPTQTLWFRAEAFTVVEALNPEAEAPALWQPREVQDFGGLG